MIDGRVGGVDEVCGEGVVAGVDCPDEGLGEGWVDGNGGALDGRGHGWVKKEVGGPGSRTGNNAVGRSRLLAADGGEEKKGGGAGPGRGVKCGSGLE